MEAIAAATTDPHFVSPWVSYIPQSGSVPSPEKFLGRIMGAPGELLGTEKTYAYARALAAASPRVRVFTIGHSEEGREILVLAIADEAGIRDLDRLKTATAALADPRRTDEAAADKLIADARPVYYFNAALHSDETGSTEAMVELAYRLAVSEQPMIRRIRERVVVLINPISNPDGRDKMVDWFYRYLKGKTDRNTLPRQSPPYWSKYTFVDINRDTHQQTHETTKAVHRMFHEWHPTVVHDLHEGVPLMMTWNGTGPYNPNIDPITYSEFLALSFHEVQAMTAMGMPGVSTWNFGEAFAHLYLDSVAMNHNSIGRGYETFGNGSAETEKRSVSSSAAAMEWYRPLPAPREVTWSARDNLNYQETGALAALDEAAGESKEMLHNFYKKSWDSWQKGLTQPPYAFLIPEDQGDPARVAAMVGRLMGQHIEVARAQNAIQLKEGTFPAGTYVVRLDQPYRNYAVDLLTPQHYPKDGEAPYDDVSWELPANYHLQAIPMADPSHSTSWTDTVDGRAASGGTGLRQRSSLLAERHGTGIVSCCAISSGEFRSPDCRAGVRSQEGQSFRRDPGFLPRSLACTMRSPRQPRNWGSTLYRLLRHPRCRDTRPKRRASDCGFPGQTPIRSAGSVTRSISARSRTHICATRIFAPGISASRIDVLLYGHVDLELAEQIEGLPKAWSPMPFKKTAQTPSFGTPAESDDITGGIGYLGLGQIQRFIDDGGLMVTLGSGSMLPLEGGLVRFVRRSSGGVPRSTAGGGGASSAASQQAATRTPGAHVRVTFDRADHPIAYGYPAHTHVFRQNFPLYNVPRRWLRMAYCTTCLDGPEDRSGIVMEWGDTDGGPFVVSGQAWGEDNLIGRPAILDMPVGKGHVVCFNFNPMHRDLNRGDQRLLWNALLNWQAILANVSKPAESLAPAPEPDE